MGLQRKKVAPALQRSVAKPTLAISEGTAVISTKRVKTEPRSTEEM